MQLHRATITRFERPNPSRIYFGVLSAMFMTSVACVAIENRIRIDRNCLEDLCGVQLMVVNFIASRMHHALFDKKQSIGKGNSYYQSDKQQ